MVEQLAVNCLELHSAIRDSDLLAISVKYLFKELELLNLLEHRGPFLLHDLVDCSRFIILAMDLVLFGNVHLLRPFKSSFKGDNALVEHWEERLSHAIDDSEILSDLR